MQVRAMSAGFRRRCRLFGNAASSGKDSRSCSIALRLVCRELFGVDRRARRGRRLRAQLQCLAAEYVELDVARVPTRHATGHGLGPGVERAVHGGITSYGE